MKQRTRITTSKFLILLGTLIIFWFLIRGLFFDGFINIHNKIDLDNSAKVGDFIGGFVGVIFTLVGIVLLYETLALQRREFIESRKVFYSQQFENKFFSLMKLYQEIINSMHYESPDSSTKYMGKEYFYKNKLDIYNEYIPTNSFYKNRKIAVDSYTKFYLKNKELIAHYFRILYRIFRLIDNANFSDNEKLNYAKITRAQLSESELFFINYNASFSYGQKFRELIVKYNITKHLPLLEKLEFKEWKQKLTDEKINSINIVFNEILDFLLHSNEYRFYKTYLKGRFAFSIRKRINEINIKIVRNNNQSYSNYLQEGYGLDDFNDHGIERLLKCWVLDTFIYRNYETLNELKNIDFKVDIIPLENNKSNIICNIKSKNNEPIKIY